MLRTELHAALCYPHLRRMFTTKCHSTVSPEGGTEPEYLPQELSNRPDSSIPSHARKSAWIAIKLITLARIVAVSLDASVDANQRRINQFLAKAPEICQKLGPGNSPSLPSGGSLMSSNYWSVFVSGPVTGYNGGQRMPRHDGDCLTPVTATN